MKKFKELYQKFIGSPKLLIIVGIILFFFTIIISILFGRRSMEVGTITPTPIPTPLVGIITLEEPVPTPSLNINWTTQDIAVPDTMDIYAINENLVNPKTADLFAQKMGFSSSNEGESIDENFRKWTRGSAVFLTNFIDNLLQYSSGTEPQAVVQNITSEIYFLTARNYLQNVFGIQTVQGFINQNVSYLDQEDLPTTPDKAVTIGVSFFQSINNFPLATLSQTGGLVTVYFDKKLTLLSLNVKNAYSKVTSIGKFKTTPLSELIQNSNTMALRINASPNQDVGAETVLAKTISFNQTSAQVGYLSKDNQLIPVYLLEGTIKTSTVPSQPGLYILPIILPQ